MSAEYDHKKLTRSLKRFYTNFTKDELYDLISQAQLDLLSPDKEGVFQFLSKDLGAGKSHASGKEDKLRKGYKNRRPGR